jgi:hypothetical protein
MSEWKPLTGRVTFLPSPQMFPQGVSALDIYKSVWAAEPDSFRKAVNPLAMSAAQGAIDEIQVTCTAGISRIDFNFVPWAPPVFKVDRGSVQSEYSVSRDNSGN